MSADHEKKYNLPESGSIQVPPQNLVGFYQHGTPVELPRHCYLKSECFWNFKILRYGILTSVTIYFSTPFCDQKYFKSSEIRIYCLFLDEVLFFCENYVTGKNGFQDQMRTQKQKLSELFKKTPKYMIF